LLTVVTPALAQSAQPDGQHNPPMSRMFELRGQVTAVDTTAGTLSVKVLSGNGAVRDKIGAEITIQTTSATIIRRLGDAGNARLTLADVTVNAFVSVQGVADNGVFTARQILLDAAPRPPREVPFNLVGQVTAVDTISSTLTVKVLGGNDAVKDKFGLEVTIQVTETTIIRHYGDAPDVRITLGDVVVDQFVSVQGRIVGETFLASEIVTDIPAPRPRQMPFNLVGQVTAVDTISSTLTMKVLGGNDAVKDKIGTEITLQTDASTVFHRFGHPSRTPVTLGDIQVDDYLMVNGRIVDGVYVAKLVIINVPRARPRP